jgi:uncharacterized HAD superfamily protein
MKVNLRIAVDLDGVLADTIAPFCIILNKRHETHFTPQSFVQWHAWETAQITKEEFFRTLDESWFDWKTIPPTEENLRSKVRELGRFGRVDIVTGRSQETVQPAISWLHYHEISYDNFVRTDSTSAKATLDYDIFIDDAPELMILLASSLDRSGILYSQPWNQNSPLLPRIHRVHNWNEIPRKLEIATNAK